MGELNRSITPGVPLTKEQQAIFKQIDEKKLEQQKEQNKWVKNYI